MKKLLGVLAFAFVVVILIVIPPDPPDPPEQVEQVEIETNPGTEIFAKLPRGEEQFLNSTSEFDAGKIKVDVPIHADVILRYNNKEEIFAYDTWKEDKFIPHDFPVLIQINVDPWAYVFIQLPDGDNFIEPRRQDFIITPELGEQNINVTPIRGGLEVPIGTAIKLVNGHRERVFSYETWKGKSQISHNFPNP